MWLHCSQLRERSQSTMLLQEHAEALGAEPDNKHGEYDPRLDVLQLHKERQAECERRLRAWVEEVLVVQDAATPQLVREAMQRGAPVLWHASVPRLSVSERELYYTTLFHESTGCFYRDNSTRTGTHVTNGRKEGIS